MKNKAHMLLAIAVMIAASVCARAADDELVVHLGMSGTNAVYTLAGRVCSEQTVVRQLERIVQLSKRVQATIQAGPDVPLGILNAFRSKVTSIGFDNVRYVLITASGQPEAVIFKPTRSTVELPPLQKNATPSTNRPPRRCEEWEQVLRPSGVHSQMFYDAIGRLMTVEPTRACVDCGRPLPLNWKERCPWCSAPHQPKKEEEPEPESGHVRK